ncbi:hypothetical protein BGW39_006209 [Mortierella sp. 14UC]|nr:hypothetical protein BGW39_006209 [Mortierella sp. 14UC]
MLPQEIQTAVADLLELQDLARLLRVSKEWNRSCTAILWRNMEITDEKRYKWFCSVRALRALSRQGHHVRTLRTPFPYILVPFQDADVIPDLLLTRLELTIPTRASQLGDDEAAYILSLVKRSPALQHLYIGTIFRHPGQLFLAINKHLTRLKTLSLFHLTRADHSYRQDHYPRIGFRLLKAFLYNLPSGLEFFALGAHAFWDEIGPESTHAPADIANFAKDEEDYLDFERHFSSGNVQQHLQMRVFSLRGMGGDQDKVLPDFLRGCPNLEVFDTPDMFMGRSITGFRLVQAALEEAVGHHLKHLTIEADEETEWDTDGDIAHTISRALTSITGNSYKEVWNKINIRRDYSSSMKATAEAIGRMCRMNLVTLHIKNMSTMESSDVQLILSQTSSLREFTSTNSPRLAARDMVAKPWACQWLTTLCLQIGGIPRPDLEMDEHGQVLYAAERKVGQGCYLGPMAIQRQVYQQLGALVNLEVLNVSRVYREGIRDVFPVDSNNGQGDSSFTCGLQTDCLDWTLESGLGQLSSLKELREVDVRQTWHRIGVRELEWMARELPRLCVLKGLNPATEATPLTSGFVPEPGTETWARRLNPDWLSLTSRFLYRVCTLVLWRDIDLSTFVSTTKMVDDQGHSYRPLKVRKAFLVLLMSNTRVQPASSTATINGVSNRLQQSDPIGLEIKAGYDNYRVEETIHEAAGNRYFSGSRAFAEFCWPI